MDEWLPDYSVRTYHRRGARVSGESLWAAARRIRLADTRRLGRLVSWRIPGVQPEQTYHELFHAYPFTVLHENEHKLVSGLCGRIWTLARDYPRLRGPDDFAGWDERGTVRVAFAHWVTESLDGAEIHSEARVHAVDTQARVRLKTIWALLGPFERLVGAEPLELAVHTAESAP